jgi:hypothetical protein
VRVHLEQFVLQFRIKPGTFEKGPSTLRHTPADRYVPADEMEWFTPRHGVHLLYGVLVQKKSGDDY